MKPKTTDTKLQSRQPDDTPVDDMDIILNHPLYKVLMDAIHQAAFGKGIRHGGATVPFMAQPWHHYAKLHGRGFLTGQAAKKLEEAASVKTGEDFRKEVLGAIVYAGAAILYEDTKTGLVFKPLEPFEMKEKT
jgi:hypothetical protein